MVDEHRHQWAGGGYEMKDMVEKPSPDEAKSNLAVFGRFLLSTDMALILSEILLSKSNKLYLQINLKWLRINRDA